MRSIVGEAETGLRDFRSCGEGTDLDQVVGQDAVYGPDPGAFGAIDAGAVPAVAALEVTDPACAASAPFDDAAERSSVFFGPSRRGRFAFARNYHSGHTEVGELLIDLGFAVAAVGGDGAWRASGRRSSTSAPRRIGAASSSARP